MVSCVAARVKTFENRLQLQRSVYADCTVLKEEDERLGLFTSDRACHSGVSAVSASESCSKGRSEGSTVEVTRGRSPRGI